MSRILCSSAAAAIVLFGFLPTHALAGSSDGLSFEIQDIRDVGQEQSGFHINVTNHTTTKARDVEIECDVSDRSGRHIYTSYTHVTDLGSRHSKTAYGNVDHAADAVGRITCKAESVKWQH